MGAGQGPKRAEVERAIGVTFANQSLLDQAFVHRSYLNENPSFTLPANERMEFLGDAVIGFVVAALLYERLPDASEGDLSALRAALVRAETLSRLARSLDLGQHIFLGRGEELSGGRQRQAILSATLEAAVGALFLDQGLEAARGFLTRLFATELERVIETRSAKDAKSLLQEIAQSRLRSTPVYQVIAEEGPDHGKLFTVAVRAGLQTLAEGRGRSKQEAEQEAAGKALQMLEQ